MFNKIGQFFRKWNSRDALEPSSARANLTLEGGMYDATMPELREVVKTLWQHVPEGEFNSLCKSDQALVESGIYLSYHRIDQAIEILKDAIAQDASYAEMVDPVIARLKEISKMPESSIEVNKQNRAMGHRQPVN